MCSRLAQSSCHFCWMFFSRTFSDISDSWTFRFDKLILENVLHNAFLNWHAPFGLENCTLQQSSTWNWGHLKHKLIFEVSNVRYTTKVKVVTTITFRKQTKNLRYLWNLSKVHKKGRFKGAMCRRSFSFLWTSLNSLHFLLILQS